MEFEGKLDGGKLVLESKPTATAVSATTIFRATYQAPTPDTLDWLFELKTETGWQLLFHSTYSRTKS
jgi:hypothetical protein